MPVKSSGENAPVRAARWNLGEEKPVDGDWVLYPQIQSKEAP